MTSATYRTWIVLFRRIKFSGVVVLVLGVLVGLGSSRFGQDCYLDSLGIVGNLALRRREH
jgi:hypothetical protein